MRAQVHIFNLLQSTCNSVISRVIDVTVFVWPYGGQSRSVVRVEQVVDTRRESRCPYERYLKAHVE